jgi:hypothetical protein
MFYVICVVVFSIRQLVARGNFFLVAMVAAENVNEKFERCDLVVFLTKNFNDGFFIKQLIIL